MFIYAGFYTGIIFLLRTDYFNCNATVWLQTCNQLLALLVAYAASGNWILFAAAFCVDAISSNAFR
jgi:hypothetical protein